MRPDRRRGQIQAMEPIIIVIFLIILLLAGGAYFLRMLSAQQDQRAEAVQAADDLALLERLTTLPELSCGGTASAGPLCVDARKARLFADMLAQNDTLRIAYYPVLGATNITLRIVDITTGNAQDILISDASRNDSARVRSTRTFVTVLEPSDGDVDFGMLEIRRSIG